MFFNPYEHELLPKPPPAIRHPSLREADERMRRAVRVKAALRGTGERRTLRRRLLKARGRAA